MPRRDHPRNFIGNRNQRGNSGEEKTLFPEDLYGAEEVFISSTNRNLLPVAAINERKIAKAPGPIVLELERIFAGYIRRYIDARTLAWSRT